MKANGIIETFEGIFASTEPATKPDPRGPQEKGIVCIRGPLHKQLRRDAETLRYVAPKTGVAHLYYRTTLRPVDGDTKGCEITFFAYDGLELMQRVAE